MNQKKIMLFFRKTKKISIFFVLLSLSSGYIETQSSFISYAQEIQKEERETKQQEEETIQEESTQEENRQEEADDRKEEKEQEELKESTLYAKGAVLLDGDSGRVLYGKEEETPMSMASTTKIMTCIIALEYGKEEDIYMVSAYAASQPKVHLGAVAGEQYRLKDLLYSLMLESHNDAAVIIAEGVAGSKEAFAALMNQKAKELGCSQTNFVTPNGLDAQGHHTTAKELAIIMKYCIKDSPKSKEFLKITQTGSYSFSDISQKKTVSCNNHNAFLSMMDGAISGKTGFTGDAGYCYVGALQRDNRIFIVALLACGWPNNKNYKWSDTKKLMEYGLQNYEYRNIYQASDLSEVKVIDGQNNTVLLKEKGEKEFFYLMKKGESIKIDIQIPDKLEAPVRQTEKVGQINYCIGEKKIKTYYVYPAENINEIDYKWCFNKIIARFLLKN